MIKKQKDIVLEVRKGLISKKDACTKHGIAQSTLNGWIEKYERPQETLLKDLLAEALVNTLSGELKGGEYTGIINALKVLTGESEEDILEVLGRLPKYEGEDLDI